MTRPAIQNPSSKPSANPVEATRDHVGTEKVRSIHVAWSHRASLQYGPRD